MEHLKISLLREADLYEKISNLILGFHGCNKHTFEEVIYRGKMLKPSKNKYDWLGHGIYFWENGYDRALNWALEKFGKDDAAVIGAVIDLGQCLNLTDLSGTKALKEAFLIMKSLYESLGYKLPENRQLKNSKDYLLRPLDCAVIEQVHLNTEKQGKPQYDSVRGIFMEGEPVYPGAGFREKSHIQLCIRNTDCIKGFFRPFL